MRLPKDLCVRFAQPINYLVALLYFATTAQTGAELVLREFELALRQVDLSHCVSTNVSGYPRIDQTKVDLSRIVRRNHKAVLLENQFLRVILLPEMGRLYSIFSKVTGHEQLWTNPIARPLLNQRNDLGWWMVWGGVEYTIPSGEHGTTWALPWRSRVIENSRIRKTIEMTVLEPKTKLEETVKTSLLAGSAALETSIMIRNTSAETVRFSHWVNPMWAPGGRGELTANTEFIIPCERVIVPPRNFNRWMLGNNVQPYAGNPLRFAENWRDIGDVLAEALSEGFYSAFSHEANEGIVRVFNAELNPGMDIWTWGNRPPPQRQKEFSLEPNLGYVEMWGGTVRDFSDESLRPLSPGASTGWIEQMFPYRGSGGLTTATSDLAVNFTISRDPTASIKLAICPAREMRNVEVAIIREGETLFTRRTDLSPAITCTHEFAARSPGVPPELLVREGTKVILRAKAAALTPIRWGAPFMPQAGTTGQPIRPAAE